MVGLVAGKRGDLAGGDLEGHARRGGGGFVEGERPGFGDRRELQYITQFPVPPTHEAVGDPVRITMLLCSTYSSMAVRPSSRPSPDAP